MKISPRTWVRWCAGLGVASTGVLAFDAVEHQWIMAAVMGAGVLVDGKTLRFWQGRMPPAESTVSKHDACLAEVARLERELADDGVLFLMTDEQFTAQVDALGRHAEPVEYMPGLVLPPPMHADDGLDVANMRARPDFFSLKEWLERGKR